MRGSLFTARRNSAMLTLTYLMQDLIKRWTELAIALRI